MKNLKNKTMAIMITLLLTTSMSAMLLLQPTSAHTPAWQIPTYAYINVAPNPAGLGQTVNIGMWINNPPPDASRTYGDRWQNYKVTVTKPDGTNETLGPFTSDDTGGTHADYAPTQLGNYSFFFSFPGQTLAGNNLDPTSAGPSAYPNIGDYYQPSNASTTLTVQQTATPPIPQNPLPTSYWNRPIESVNQYYYSISGNWLGLGVSTFSTTGMYNATGNYNPDTTAPTTAHLLWTKPGAPGGLIGGEFGATETSNFNAPQQYQPKFAPVIMNGILYYEQYPDAQSTPEGWVAINLHTGQTLWTMNASSDLLCGQLLDYVTPNQYGALTYLWGISPTTAHGAVGSVVHPNTPPNTGTTYTLYDATTGNYVLTIVNGTGMTLTEDDGGNLIGYYVNSSTANAYHAPTLNMWNSTQCIDKLNPKTPGYSYSGQSEWYWEPIQNDIIPFSYGIQWSAPLATNISGVALPSNLGISSTCIENGVILMSAAGSGGTGSFQVGFQIEAGYDATTGAQLWITNRTETPNTRLYTLPATAGNYAEVNYNTAVVNGYSMTTGQLAWGPITLPNPNPYDSLGGYQAVSANGTCYMWGFGGTIYAINMATGAIMWHTTTEQISGPSGSDTPYGVWPLWTFTVGSVAGGILFVPEGHQYSPPMFRGASQLAINITNGQPVWSILGFDVTSGPAVADGIMTTFNSYDNQIYAYGMGPSKTTVNAPSVGVTTSTTITISGTVTDISAGSQQEAVAANFPNGLPCVSDASMTPFMEAVYEQQPCPTNVTGVPVAINVIDSNGNSRQIGTTTSNADGTFSFTWAPDISGAYTVTANFAGSNSYYPSSAKTSFVATAAPATASPQPTQAPSMSDLYFVPAIAGLFVVIIVVGALMAILLLRKRP
jgi:hypothetical protein